MRAPSLRLDPCFNGERSVGRDVVHNVSTHMVLILVLMEDGLRVLIKKFHYAWYRKVLILVLVEDGLRGIAKNERWRRQMLS